MNTISEFDLHLVLEWLENIEYTVSELNEYGELND